MKEFSDKNSGHRGTIIGGMYSITIVCKDCDIEISANTESNAKKRFVKKHKT